MRLAWATDIHLDHASEAARRKFCQSVNDQADALVVTGDIPYRPCLFPPATPTAAARSRWRRACGS